jgi:hypothetical protein
MTLTEREREELCICSLMPSSWSDTEIRKACDNYTDFIESMLVERVQTGVREFVEWVGHQRAYNGAPDPGQSLYNDRLNAVLPQWAEEWLER